jgi:maleylpyruvate isomerase
MDVPSADIELCRAAHQRLREVVGGIDDADLTAPCLLPGWSVSHLLNHVARNADSMVRRLDGARRDEILDQYPGGPAGRVAEIDAGVGRPLEAVVADVVATADRVDAAFASFPADRWGRLGRSVYGVEEPVAILPFLRAREVHVHLVDLGTGYTPADWPAALAERWLPELLRGLPDRSDPTALLAWALRRGPAPELDPF